MAYFSVEMNRFGSTQIHDHVHSRIGDTVNEVPAKTPARRGLAGLNVNATRTVDKKSNSHNSKSQLSPKKIGHGPNAFTPCRTAPVPLRLNQSSRKQKAVFVYEDSPEKAQADVEPEEDEEIETCAPASNGDRSLFYKSIRQDCTILPAEEYEEESEGEEEKEEEEGGVERYFKSIYNVAENADEMWDNLEVQAHDSDTEIEYCGGDPFNQSYEWALFMDGIEEIQSRTDAVLLEDSSEFVEVMRRWRAMEEEEEECSSGVDENDQSI